MTPLFFSRITLPLNRLPIRRRNRDLLATLNLVQARLQSLNLSTQAEDHLAETRIQLHGT